MINFAHEIDGALRFTKGELQAEGYTITWRGKARLVEDFDGSNWTAPIVAERNGTLRPGYISGAYYVVFDRVTVAGTGARTEAQRAAAECCGW